MAGGYENEDRQAELEEHRHRREQEERERLERERLEHARHGLRRDNLPEPGEMPRPRDHEDDAGKTPSSTDHHPTDHKGHER